MLYETITQNAGEFAYFSSNTRKRHFEVGLGVYKKFLLKLNANCG